MPNCARRWVPRWPVSSNRTKKNVRYLRRKNSPRFRQGAVAAVARFWSRPLLTSHNFVMVT
jgi:hypothetical protein